MYHRSGILSAWLPPTRREEKRDFSRRDGLEMMGSGGAFPRGTSGPPGKVGPTKIHDQRSKDGEVNSPLQGERQEGAAEAQRAPPGMAVP